AELSKEKDASHEMEKDKILLEKTIKELNARIVDLESTSMSRDAGSLKRLEGRVEELTTQLDTEVKEKNEMQKTARKSERIVRELQFQLSERDKHKARNDEEMEKLEQKVRKMKTQIEEL
ncbi:myosin tail, partial [Blyttiomyces helicus]